MNQDMNVLAENVATCLTNLVDQGVTVRHTAVVKNNGVVRQGISLITESANAFPTLYVEDYFPSIKSGGTAADIAQKMFEEFVSGKHGAVQADIPELSEAFFREKARIRLINYERNKARLAEMPHRRVMDLAVVAHFETTVGEHRGTALITNALLERLGMSSEELIDCAIANTGREGFTFSSMKEVLAELTGAPVEFFPDDPMLVGTNKDKYLGAAILLYPDAFAGIAEKLNEEGLWILPSSVHEVIILPKSEGKDVEELQEMVRGVNADTENVPSTDYLSDSVYEYVYARRMILQASA